MNRILTINIGNYWHPNAKASVVAAAKRWGCELIEIASDFGCRDIFAAKFRVGQFCHADGRCLYLDADMLIRADAPSPFVIVPASHMAAVANWQDGMGDEQEGYEKPSWARACQQLGKSHTYHRGAYVNGGLVMFSAEHLPVLRFLDRAMTDTTGVNEQAAWGVAMMDAPTYYLPSTWNRVGPAVWNSGPRMSDYVYHFACYMGWRGHHKAEKINAVRWQNC